MRWRRGRVARIDMDGDGMGEMPAYCMHVEKAKQGCLRPWARPDALISERTKAAGTRY